jgi:hypothetical protein
MRVSSDEWGRISASGVGLGGLDRFGDVAWDEGPSHSLREGFVEHRVYLVGNASERPKGNGNYPFDSVYKSKTFGPEKR